MSPSTVFAFIAFLAALPGPSIFAAPITGPDQIKGLGLWLSADALVASLEDGAPVLKWPDKSGNGFDAIFEPNIPYVNLGVAPHHSPTFKRNALQGHPVVSFDANNG